MLLGGDRFFVNRIALGNLWQALVVVVHHRIIAALFIDTHKAVKQHHLTGGTQNNLPVIAAHINRGALKAGLFHLAGQRAFPDQVIQLALVRLQPRQFARIHRHIGRADTFVGLLGVLGLVLVDTRFGWDVFLAITGFDFGAGGGYGLGGHVDAVGPHIGDVTGLIQALRGAHRLARAKAEFARGLLLQGRGHEGGGGIAVGRFRLDLLYHQIAAVHRLHGQFGGGAVFQIEFVQF